jgi:hypothetical protein
MTIITDLPASHAPCEDQLSAAGGHPLLTDQGRYGTHTSAVGGHSLSTSRTSPEAHTGPARGDAPPTNPSMVVANPRSHSTDGWAELRIAAELYQRAQQERIAVANLIRPSADGGNIDEVWFAGHLARLEVVEHEAGLMLRRCYRRVVPAELRELQRSNRGIGEHLFARLLGHLGDPFIATPHYWEGAGSARTLMALPSRTRTVGQLWQFAGHGAPSRRIRGMTAEEAMAHGNPIIKMLVHLNAEACMKQPNGNRYRDIYVASKLATDGRAHTTDCVRCGPSGRPSPAGSPWSDAHRHAHALRIVGKELLRDMWLVRRSAVIGVPIDSEEAA